MDAIITFKAGKCELEGKKVKPDPTPGFLYLHIEDDILHLSWRPRSSPAFDPEFDLIMFPGDCTFFPYTGPGTTSSGSSDKTSPTNGRLFELKFTSSSQRHYFWLQSKSQHKDGNASWFSKRDLLLGSIVNNILADDEDAWRSELAQLRRGGSAGDGGPDASGDGDAMEDVQGGNESDAHRQISGGAGPDSTGGGPRGESDDSRRGGNDGGRAAANDTNDVVQNFLRSLQGTSLQSQPQPQQQQQQSYDKPFTSLPELFNTQTTTSYLSTASPHDIDNLCSYLPPSIFLLSQESAQSLSSTEPTSEAGGAAIEALSTDQKRDILERVLRSPQLHQSLGSLTQAIRDGGLPQIGEALRIDVENGGLIRGGAMPLGGGEAVEAFLDGTKRTAEKEKKK